MVHYHFLLAHWLSLRYTSIFYWSTGPPCDTLPTSTGSMTLPMVHVLLLLANWLSLWYTYTFFWPTGCSYGIYYVWYLLLAHWLSLWYTNNFYWPTGYLYGTLLSPIGPLVISMEHFYLLLTLRISLLYTTLSY